eukprot:scaffold91019_cov49-Attheya_sp.AAC.2
MKLQFAFVALSAAIGSVALQANGFGITRSAVRPRATVIRPVDALSMGAETEGSVCDIPAGDVVSSKLTSAESLRSAALTNVDGDVVRLGDVMGEGTSVKEKLGDTAIKGPIFISIGDSEKLETFLELNPYIPRDKAFVDDYSFAAYKSAGFGRFDETPKEDLEGFKMEAPDLGGFGGWMKYMGNVMKLAPVPKDMKFGEVPEGVLRLGGTFVVKGDDVVYQWSDKIPGDHPDIPSVIRIAKEEVGATV